MSPEDEAKLPCILSRLLKAVFPCCMLFCRWLLYVVFFNRTHGNDNIKTSVIRFFTICHMENRTHGNDNIQNCTIWFLHNFLPSAKKHDRQKLSAKKHAPWKHSLRTLVLLHLSGCYVLTFVVLFSYYKWNDLERSVKLDVKIWSLKVICSNYDTKIVVFYITTIKILKFQTPENLF